MRQWFIWNGVDSRTMGVYVASLPAKVRASERVTYQTIPGRPGSLSIKEGDGVYDAYELDLILYHIKHHPLAPVLTWLRGAGTLILSDEPDRMYTADIASEVSFERASNDWEQATITLMIQPYKAQYPPEYPVSVTGSTTLYNPGDIASKPKITVPAPTGETGTITINNVEYTFTAAAVVDCDAEMVLVGGAINLEAMDLSDGFPVLETGANTVTVSGFSGAVTIEPRWRWV